jgi:hypothetical protein
MTSNTNPNCFAYVVLPPKGFYQKVIKGPSLNKIAENVQQFLSTRGFQGDVKVADLVGLPLMSSESKYQRDEEFGASGREFFYDINQEGKLKPHVDELQTMRDTQRSILTARFGNTVLKNIGTIFMENYGKIMLVALLLLVAAVLLTDDPSAYVPNSMHTTLSTTSTSKKFVEGAKWWTQHVQLYEDDPNQPNQPNQPNSTLDRLRHTVQRNQGPQKNPVNVVPFIDRPARRLKAFLEPQEGTLANLRGLQAKKT